MLSKGTKIGIIIVCLIISIIGFMIKLPSAFRHMDKELHALFYFLAAAFANLLYANRKITLHIIIFILLFLFGVAIEYAQAYSNTFFRVRIHGRFDIEDVAANTKGLLAFSIVWIMIVFVMFVYRKSSENK